MDRQPKILIAGSTGYLGLHIVSELLASDANFVALSRSKDKLLKQGVRDEQICIAQVTDPKSLVGCCDGFDVVISCLGITRQRDGLTYMDVDYQANINLLEEAKSASVEKFIYISALNANQNQQVRLLHAKEKFAQTLLDTEELEGCVIRPNGFFCDMAELFNMAKQGRVYLFGDGEQRLNPIHGRDLAKFTLQAMHWKDKELDVGGPEILSHREAAELAFEAINKKTRVTYLPDRWRRGLVWGASRLPEQWTGPAEFFLTVSGKDMLAPTYGGETLAEFYGQLAAND
ncbi:SDR family oxidoreductase [Vibrio sonorensis]|uniref:SDR family oxidoreductase n=1 Tax=Vibrio sonorensis TaxID=1004316 RepID=UPI0008D92E58|nr:SDR family oxidoreductase [Vibrio sonorensis]